MSAQIEETRKIIDEVIDLLREYSAKRYIGIDLQNDQAKRIADLSGALKDLVIACST